MSWMAVACAMAANIAEQRRQFDRDRPLNAVRAIPDLEQLAKDRCARIEADTRKVLRDAWIGTALLFAFIATAAYGAAQLLGLA